MLLIFARIWAYPLWRSVTRSEAADTVSEDVDWWMRCIDDANLLALDRYSRFAYLTGTLAEFRTLIHYRLRSALIALRLLPACGVPPPRPSPSTRIGSIPDSSSSTTLPTIEDVVTEYQGYRLGTLC